MIGDSKYGPFSREVTGCSFIARSPMNQILLSPSTPDFLKSSPSFEELHANDMPWVLVTSNSCD